MSSTPRYYLTGWQSFFFVLLRIGIGWHFLREGWIKLCDPTWTAVGYLVNSWGPLSPYFRLIGETPWMLNIANFTMPWMLFLSGLGMMLGLFTRSSILLAMVLLVMFYLAAPPIEAVDLAGVDAQLVVGTILDTHALAHVCAGADAVVHLAAIGSVPRCST